MKIKDKIISCLMGCATYIMVFFVGYILLDIIIKGVPVINWEFLTENPSDSGLKGGIFPVIIGTIWLIGITILVALPLGIASAIYLAEYAKQGRFVNFIRMAIVTLAGIPSIVFGLFGLGLFVYFFNFGTSILAGSLTLACMILPIVIVSSEEALKAVPKSLREGSLALGASKWQTIRRNVLPYSIPGMMTGSILGIGRAAGETAPIMLTAVAFLAPTLPKGVYSKCMALPYHLFILSTQVPDLERARAKQYGTAVVLLMLVLGLSSGAVIIRTYFRRKHKW